MPQRDVLFAPMTVVPDCMAQPAAVVRMLGVERAVHQQRVFALVQRSVGLVEAYHDVLSLAVAAYDHAAQYVQAQGELPCAEQISHYLGKGLQLGVGLGADQRTHAHGGAAVDGFIRNPYAVGQPADGYGYYV